MTESFKCGKVTEEERNQIKKLYLRKTALSDLFFTLGKCSIADSSEFYDKVVMDYGETIAAFQSWWEMTAQKYGWPSKEGGSWKIDFDTCEISLT